MFYIISIVCLFIAALSGFYITLRMNKEIEKEKNSGSDSRSPAE